MRIKNLFAHVGLITGFLACQPLGAVPSQVPIFLMSGTESMVMLNMSNDHELFFKAYDDYSDIDGDGLPERTYKHSIDYYGYFESDICYAYSSGEFVPQAKSTTKYCDTVSGDWSGNFLNWATMSRMDAIRKVLYGGYRSTDTSTQTILERTFLPTDAHSFVKYYSDLTDIRKLTPYSKGISICNTTQANAGGSTLNSRNVTEPPLMRVAQGDYSMWTAHEQVQCQWSQENNNTNNNQPLITGIQAATHPPSRFATGSAEMIVRVEVCKSAALEEANCKVYPSGNSKPIGTLQEHGDDGSVKFGLMTGSYEKNKSGGVLRKNVSAFTDEVEEKTTGQFTNPAPADSIVDTLNKLRLTRYDYNKHQYNSLDSCAFAKFGFSDGECSNWGNPQSEIYLESLRYFGGLGASSAFDVGSDEDSYIKGLTTATWSDPLNNNNYCAPVNIIHFNASTSSFDGDQLAGFAGLPGAPSVDAWTDDVGDGGVDPDITNAGRYFVGSVAGTTSPGDKSCTPKDLDHLSDATGICPEAPWLEGTYKIAGMAYYANLNSIRNDLLDVNKPDPNNPGSYLPAIIEVETYGVALTPAQPIIQVPVPGSSGKEVYILPACMEFRSDSSYPSGRRHNGNCAIVDFRIVQPHTVTGGIGYGKFMVLWESAQHGGDYDQDMGGIIEYWVSSTQIAVRTQVYGASTGGIHGFGYVISGTTQDGLHIHSGHKGFKNYTDPYGLIDCSTAPGTAVAGECHSPNSDPNSPKVGDAPTTITYTIGATSATALETPLYYAAKFGGFVEEADASKRPPSTSAPDDIPNEDYEWDSNNDGLPDNYFFARNPGQLSSQLSSVFNTIATVSSSASVVANSVSLQTSTRIYQARFDSADWSGKLLSFPVTISTGALQTEEWDAGAVIAGQNWDTQRVWVSSDGSTGIPFRWASLTTGSPSQQEDLNRNPDTGLLDTLGSDRLDYLRGDTSNELANGGRFRNRSTPLGDVVHSTPTVVAAPTFSNRDYYPGTTTLIHSQKYSDFKLWYGDSECFAANGTTRINSWSAGSGTTAGGREPMVYFGANDGALHGVSACTGHERLAYVPHTLYPELSKLTGLDYMHQYYVDGPPTVVDAFWGSAWHTVLLGTLRGGGKAVFALDVTDPNNFSESNASSIVKWEINPTSDLDGDSVADYPELGYTFSQPAVINAEGHGWVAVFGNGYHGASGKAVLYIARIYDGRLLASVDLSAVNAGAHGSGNGLSTVSPIDVDGDGDVDLIYGGDLNGNVWRFAATTGVGFAAGTTTLLYSAKDSTGLKAQPITARLAVGRHPTSAVGRMVYFGTGKYYEPADQDPGNAVQYNTMYGIWDRDIGSNISTGNFTVTSANKVNSVTARNSNILQKQTILQETSGTFGSNTYEVRTVSNTGVTWVTPTGTCAANSSCGWYLDLTDTGEKMVSTPILRGGRLIFVTTIPSLIPCQAGGSGWLMEIDPNTGGRLDTPVFDLNGDGVFDVNDKLVQGTGGTQTKDDVSGKKSKVGILQPPAILAGVGGPGDGSYGGAEGKYSSGTQNAQIEVTIENPGLLGSGRKSWVRVK